MQRLGRARPICQHTNSPKPLPQTGSPPLPWQSKCIIACFMSGEVIDWPVGSLESPSFKAAHAVHICCLLCCLPPLANAFQQQMPNSMLQPHTRPSVSSKLQIPADPRFLNRHVTSQTIKDATSLDPQCPHSRGGAFLQKVSSALSHLHTRMSGRQCGFTACKAIKSSNSPAVILPAVNALRQLQLLLMSLPFRTHNEHPLVSFHDCRRVKLQTDQLA